jgi:DNA-binding protein HU-beta
LASAGLCASIRDSNIAQLADQIAAKQNLDKGQARKVVEATLKAVVDAAKGGDEVSLPGFGKFKAQDRPERAGRNPATGEAMTFAASRKLAFTPAKAVKEALNS